jgi:hypothetical protein
MFAYIEIIHFPTNFEIVDIIDIEIRDGDKR